MTSICYKEVPGSLCTPKGFIADKNYFELSFNFSESKTVSLSKLAQSEKVGFCASLISIDCTILSTRLSTIYDISVSLHKRKIAW